MPISIAGSGTITGISAGGLPDGVITTDDIAAAAITRAKMGYAGAILQVVQGTYTASASIATNINVGAASYASTGLTASITPSSSSSKIAIFYTLNGSTDFNTHMVTAIRRAISGGATSHPFLGDSASGWTQVGSGMRGIGSNIYAIAQQSGNYLDSPNTTSAVTYTIVGASENAGTWYINSNGANSSGNTWSARFASSITLMEVAA